MTRRLTLAVVMATAALSAVPMMFPQSANAQVEVYVGQAPPTVPPRAGPLGDRDHDGIPNAFDHNNNNRAGYRDQDHDGVPNRYDRDRDGDGVPNRYDRAPDNPDRR